MNYPSIERVAFFMNMVLSGVQLDSEAAKEELKNDDVLFNYMGNGASDSLTVKDITGFIEEVNRIEHE